MTGYSRTPKAGSLRRQQLEQDIALGTPNSRLMARYGISYEQLRNILADMNGEPAPALQGRPAIPKRHGTEAAFLTHRRKRQTPCEQCATAHLGRVERQREARRIARADKRLRGVA